uniref:hypothetical protein n=1 Tax=Flavobacterium sp. TaxID=239 RepID=UPI0040498E96
MTNLQKKIFDLISKKEPICDLCIGVEHKRHTNQYANNQCNKLKKDGLINREKGHCITCNRENVLLNTTK